MKWLVCLVFVQISITCLGQVPSSRPTFNADSFNRAKLMEPLGKPFNGFTVANEEGPLNNDSLKGKIVLINFWFEGCHPCIAEFPALNELADKLKDVKDFEFISFTWDNQETVKRVKEKFKLQFRVYSTQESSKLNYRLGYPTTIILDRQGIVKYITSGGPIDPEKARNHIMTEILPRIQQEL